MIDEEYDNNAKLHYKINEPIILQLWESVVFEYIRSLNPISGFDIRSDLVEKLYKSLLDRKISMVLGQTDDNNTYKIDLGLFSIDLFKGFPYKITPRDLNSPTYFLYKYKILNTINLLYRISDKSVVDIDLNDVLISDFSEEFKNILNQRQEDVCNTRRFKEE